MAKKSDMMWIKGKMWSLCVDCCCKVWPDGAWVVPLTVWGPLTHPCHTDPVTSWRGRRWLRRPPVGIQLRMRSLCRPPVARTHTPHSALLCTTSSPRHDIWDDEGNLSAMISTQIWYKSRRAFTKTKTNTETEHHSSSVLYSVFNDKEYVKINDWLFHHVCIMSLQN